ncbi:MAG: hypothetical protein ACT4PZ_20875 [Panacagrimonas sp.]
MFKNTLFAVILVCASATASAAPGDRLSALLNVGGKVLNPLLTPLTSISGPIAGRFVSRVAQTGIFAKLGNLAVHPVQTLLPGLR